LKVAENIPMRKVKSHSSHIGVTLLSSDLSKPKDDLFKHDVVKLILSRRTEEAIEMLADRFMVEVPRIKVGHWKGRKNVLAVYVSQRQTIFVAKSSEMWNPFVILHEFYHHLRSKSGKHRGTEKLADSFAIAFIRAFLDVEYKGTATPTSPP
jgi:hypothetical protein